MYLFRLSVRYASSANSVFKPINFKHKPRYDEIPELRRSHRNNKYDGNSRQSSRDYRENPPGVEARDEEGLAVIRSPIDPIRGTDHPSLGFVDDRLRRRPSRDQSYEGDREDGDRHFSSRRRNLSYECDREEGDRHSFSRRINRSSDGDREEVDRHSFSRRINRSSDGDRDDVGDFKNRGKYEDYRDPDKNSQGRFQGRQFDDYRQGKYDSRYKNDEFTHRQFDQRHGNAEHKWNNSSTETHVRDQDNWHNNSRMRHVESDYRSKGHVTRGNAVKLSLLSGDSSLGDVENLFGIHPVLLALRAGKRTMHKIFCKQGIEKTNPKIKEIYELAADNSIEFVSVHGSEIKQVFKGDTVHQGIFCLASPLPISVFNIDSCQELLSSLIDSVTLEDSSTTKNNFACSEESPRNKTDDEFNSSSVNSNKMARYAGDAPLPSISDNLCGQETQGAGTYSAQLSLNSPLNVEPTGLNQSHAGISSAASLSTTALSSAVASAAMQLERDGSSSADNLTAVPSSEAWPERDGCSSVDNLTAVPSSEAWPEQDGCSSVDNLTAVPSSEAGPERDGRSSADNLTALPPSEAGPERDGRSSADNLTVVPSSEAGPERDGRSGTVVASSSELRQPSEVQSKPQLWLLLDNVVDAMNVGAVLRSCCYFGVDRVLFTPSCADISPVVSKASSGAAELLSLSLIPQPGPTLAALRRRGWTVLLAVSRGAESPHRPRPLHEYALTGNTLLVVGNEGSGVSATISEQADAAVIIPATGPLAGALGCLNVSVAAAITLHALTSRTRPGEEDETALA